MLRVPRMRCWTTRLALYHMVRGLLGTSGNLLDTHSRVEKSVPASYFGVPGGARDMAGGIGECRAGELCAAGARAAGRPAADAESVARQML